MVYRPEIERDEGYKQGKSARKKRKSVINEFPEKPPCFDSQQQFNDWYSYAYDAVTSILKNTKKWGYFNICIDCSQKYRDEMLYEGRCTDKDMKYFDLPTATKLYLVNEKQADLKRKLKKEYNKRKGKL